MNRVKMLGSKQRFFALVFILTELCTAGAFVTTEPPMVPSYSLLFMWNTPYEGCTEKDLPLDLSHFPIITSTTDTAINQSIILFYTHRFGIYPSVHYNKDKTYKVKHDGVPQKVNMKDHIAKAEIDISKYLPEDNIGLAVIDFEDWRPLWVRNWSDKDIYRKISIQIVKDKNPSLSDSEATAEAKIEFESAAKTYLIESLNLGKRMRPTRLWGYYLFPDCYNTALRNMDTYDGKCPEISVKRNDELMWLWKESTGLFPSIYLVTPLKNYPDKARLYVRYRIQEAIRVSMLPNSSYSVPVYAYIRPLYKDTLDGYMTELELVNTIGEAAALGSAGIISWGDLNVCLTADSAKIAQTHLRDVMNFYVLNLTKATQLCSEAICQGRGRCVRKIWDSDVYIHLNPKNYRIYRDGDDGPLKVSGHLTQEDVNWYGEYFDCMCYGYGPCRAIKIVSEGNRGADASTCVLVAMILICLNYVLM